MKNKFQLILALACALCFTTNLVAQDVQGVDQPEKPKAAKKANDAKRNKSLLAKSFGGAELTEGQKTQLTKLVAAKKKELVVIRKSVSELISKEDAKSVRLAVRKSTKGGMGQAEALKSAWGEVGLSPEAQTTLTKLGKQQTEIEQEIINQIVATFSDDQKEAMKAGMKKGKQRTGKGGKKKKGKNKKNKDKKKMEQPEQN